MSSEEVLIAKLEGKLESIGGKVDFVRDLIDGGRDPEKGLVVKVDRLEKAVARMELAATEAIEARIAERLKALEDAETRRRWWVGTTATAAIGSLAIWVREKLISP